MEAKHHVNKSSVDPKTGFNSVTKTFHSLRPPVDLPPQHVPLSVADYALSLRLNSPWKDSAAFINSETGLRVNYSEFIHRVQNLAAYLQKKINLRKGDVAFILSSNRIEVPILFFALLKLGVIVSPANPMSTESELSRQIKLSNPKVAFATSSTVSKLPPLSQPPILLDSVEFYLATLSFVLQFDQVEVNQSDLAVIMYSSGTTGHVKGVMLTHHNFTAIVAGYHTLSLKREKPAVLLYTVPYFHVYGFFYCLKSVVLSEASVVMERFELRKMLKAVGDFGVTHLTAVPPLVVAMVKGSTLGGCDMSSLEAVIVGAAPISKDVMAAFMKRFPGVLLMQGYGLTEASGAAFRMICLEEWNHLGSAGRLAENCEAKIVDPDSGEALPPCKRGELWFRGPTVMKGYIGDPEATSAAITADGWLRTGDICYIDEEGFLHVVDRLKELIKYKGYQVAPAELEHLLQAHPEIADAAVVPYPDDEAGQVPMAFVARQPWSNLSEADIIDYVAKQVAPYKKIRRVAFINSIPRSPAGKILRRELRKIIDLSMPSSKL